MTENNDLPENEDHINPETDGSDEYSEMNENSEQDSSSDENAQTSSAQDEKSSESDPVAQAAAEAENLKDKLLRAVAENENFRRRAERERADAANYAITSFARDLLTVGDNLRRALDHIPEDAELGDNAKNLVEGIQMTERELLNLLERHNIKQINPMGEKFDHNFHQAMFETPGTGEPDGTIIQVMQVGYVIKDRLLRPAMVGVAKGGEQKPVEHVDTTA